MKNAVNFGVRLIKKNIPWVVLIALLIVFNSRSANFLSFKNIYNILTQNAYVAVAAIGITLIMMTGHMDLSIGYQMSLIGVLTAMLVVAGVPLFLCVLSAMAMGAVICMINCIISIRFKIPLIMVSLGMMAICQGLSYEISGAYSIYNFTSGFAFIGQGSFGGVVSTPIIIAAVIFTIMTIVLNKTYFGRYIYTIGSNSDAANLAGISVNRVRLTISAIEGALIGLSAVMMISRVGSAHSSMGVDMGFTCLTGIMLGGVSLRGGEGKLSGSIAGILILGTLSNGMQLAGLGIYIQYVVKGLIMLFAIGIDVYMIKRRHSNATKRIHETESTEAAGEVAK